MKQEGSVRPCSRCGRHIDEMETIHAVQRQVICDQCYRAGAEPAAAHNADTYEVKERLFGRPIVSYRCPHCRSQLQSPLDEANSRQECPTCSKPFVTPGGAALAKQIRKDEAALAAEAVAQAQKRKKAELKKATAAAEAAYRASHPPPPPRLVWYGEMHCSSCGYSWNSRRGTPPAKCAGCNSRKIYPVEVPERKFGCLTLIVLLSVATVALLGGLRWGVS